MRIVCISDTHNRPGMPAVPEGDILIHAGDLTMQGSLDEIRRARNELVLLPHRYKVVIAGNHDFAFQNDSARARAIMDGLIYLQDEEVTIAGLRFWGSPWQPWFYDWAFNLRRGAPIAEKWALIPTGIDVLITHGPPAGHGDMTPRGEAVGCVDLLAAIEKIRPRLHVFGHIHEGYGRTEADGTIFANASTCDLRYHSVNPPLVFDLDPR